MDKHSFTPAFYQAVYRKIKEAKLEVTTEDNVYGYFNLSFTLRMYDVSLTARFKVTADLSDYLYFGRSYSNKYPAFDNLIEIDNVKVYLTNGTPVEGFSIDDFWKQFNVNMSPCGLFAGEKVVFRCPGSLIIRKGTFVAYNREMDCDVVEEEVTGRLYYIKLPVTFIGKVREPPN